MEKSRVRKAIYALFSSAISSDYGHVTTPLRAIFAGSSSALPNYFAYRE
jgi:hypothetical protein